MQLVDSPLLPVIGGAFRCIMPVRWGDQDAQNHVNNVMYFRYFEEARVQLFELAGITMPSARMGVLAHTSCDFLKPLVYPANVVVTQVLTRVGGSSMAVDTLIERDDEPGQAYAKGKYVIVGVDAATGKPSRWTAAELAKFAQVFVA